MTLYILIGMAVVVFVGTGASKAQKSNPRALKEGNRPRGRDLPPQCQAKGKALDRVVDQDACSQGAGGESSFPPIINRSLLAREDYGGVRMVLQIGWYGDFV
jgi:hypothetical protein